MSHRLQEVFGLFGFLLRATVPTVFLVNKKGNSVKKNVNHLEKEYHSPGMDALLAEEAAGGIEQVVPGRRITVGIRG